MALDIPFKAGDEVTYAAIQSTFRGQSGKGMSCSLETKSLVLIMDAQKKKKAAAIYEDTWDERDILHYRGVGQRGDQNINYEGNKWLSRSAEMGIGVYLFERVTPKTYRYYGEVVLIEAPYRRREPDAAGESRWVWVFPVKRRENGDVPWQPPDNEMPLKEPAGATAATPLEPQDKSQTTGLTHEDIQALLLELGGRMGMELWLARNDHTHVSRGVTLGNMPGIRDSLPRQFDTETMRTIELIDVLWLDGNSIEAAFEIENTTSVYSGLLRMSDLLAMQPNLNISLYIVAPQERRDKVRKELLRPTFRTLKRPIHERCGFISYERLLELRTALGPNIDHVRPSVLDKVAERFSP